MEFETSKPTEAARLRFFSDALVLRSLCSPDGLKDMETILRSGGRSSSRRSFRLINGYKLVVVAVLYQLLNSIILYPEFMGLETDTRLMEWWMYDPNKEGIASRSAFTEPESDLAKTLVYIQGTMSQFREADTWRLTVDAVNKARPLGDALCASAFKCPVSSFRSHSNLFSIEDAIRLGATERLTDYWPDRAFSIAYRYLWYRKSRWDMRDAPQEWRTGMVATTYIAYYQINAMEDSNGRISSMSDSVHDLLHTLYSELRVVFGDEYPYPSLHYGLKPCQVPSLQELIETPINPVNPEDRLRSLLANEIKLVASADLSGLVDFEVLLRGLASELEDAEQDTGGDAERIEVIRIRHSIDSGGLMWFSLAVRRPLFGLFSNNSKWWVFHKAYFHGGYPDPSEVQAAKMIEKVLQDFDQRIKLIELDGISTDYLLELCEPPEWQNMSKRNKELNDLVSDLRGAIPELSATALLAHWGYQNIRNSFKPRVLDGLELDVLGVKDDHCLVIETKGQATADTKLSKEFGAFTSKVERLNQHLIELSAEVDYGGQIASVSGIFASMGADRYAFKVEDVKFWTYQDFVGELERAGLPSRYIKLLERKVIAHTRTLGAPLETRIGEHEKGKPLSLSDLLIPQAGEEGFPPVRE